MRKNNEHHLGKTLALSAASIGLASALFVGVNGWVFAAETDKTENLAPVENEVVDTAEEFDTADEIQAVKDYKEPSLTVYEFETLFYSVDENGEEIETYGVELPVKDSAVLSIHEAALIGAEYIWEIFGADIDGSYVEMFYETSNRTNRSYWSGSVGNTQEDMEEGIYSYSFIVDAVSGEKKSVQFFQDLPFQEEEFDKKGAYPEGSDERMEITIEYENKRKEHSKAAYAADPEAYEEAAREAGQKHFKNSTVVDVVYLEDRVADGIVFSVIDDNGTEIDVAIYTDTVDVEFIDDRRDEIDPNFVPDPNAIG